MTKTSINAELNLGLKSLGFKREAISNWNNILHEFLDGDLEIIEFQTNDKEKKYWGLSIQIIKEKVSTDEESVETKPEISESDLNLVLEKAFDSSDDETAVNWDHYFSTFILGGLFLPIEDIYHVDDELLKSHLGYYEQLLQHFPYQDFFSDLQVEIEAIDNEDEKLPLIIWTYIKHYVQFLKKLDKKKRKFCLWYTELLDISDFHKRLPSEQLIILMLRRCESYLFDASEYRYNKISDPKGVTAVRKFYEKFDKEYISIFLGQTDTLPAEKISWMFKEMQWSFMTIFKHDAGCFLIQDLLDNQSGLSLSALLPLGLQLKYGPKSVYNVSGIIKDAVLGDKERPAGEFKEHDKALPVYFRPQKIKYPAIRSKFI